MNNAEDLIREAYRRSQGRGKTYDMARQIVERILAGEHPGFLVCQSPAHAENVLDLVKEMLRAHGIVSQEGDYEPVSRPRPTGPLSAPVQTPENYTADDDFGAFMLRALSRVDQL